MKANALDTKLEKIYTRKFSRKKAGAHPFDTMLKVITLTVSQINIQRF